jgi:hypothetical protein
LTTAAEIKETPVTNLADIPAGTLVTIGDVAGVKLHADHVTGTLDPAATAAQDAGDYHVIMDADATEFWHPGNTDATPADDAAVTALVAEIRGMFPEIVDFLQDASGMIDYYRLAADDAVAYAAICRIAQEEPRAALLGRVLQNAEQAAQWLRDMDAAGLGAHPDAAGGSLLKAGTDEPLFSKAEAEAYDMRMADVFRLLPDVYETSLDIMQERRDVIAAEHAQQA